MKNHFISLLALVFVGHAFAADPITTRQPVPVEAKAPSKQPTTLMRQMEEGVAEYKKLIKTPRMTKDLFKVGRREPQNFLDLWNKLPVLTHDEAVAAYGHMGDIGAYAVPTHAWLMEFIDMEGVAIEPTMRRGFSTGYHLEILSSELTIRYSRDKKAQEAEFERVNIAAVAAAVKAHRAIMDNLDPDAEKKYPYPSAADIQKRNPPPPDDQVRQIRDKECTQNGHIRFRAFTVDQERQHVEPYLGRIFVRFIPGQKDRVREALIAAGYPTPESRAAFWKRIGADPQYYFNASHIALVYDPKKP